MCSPKMLLLKEGEEKVHWASTCECLENFCCTILGEVLVGGLVPF